MTINDDIEDINEHLIALYGRIADEGSKAHFEYLLEKITMEIRLTEITMED